VTIERPTEAMVQPRARTCRGIGCATAAARRRERWSFSAAFAKSDGRQDRPAMDIGWMQGLVTTLNPQEHAGTAHHHSPLGAKDVEKGPCEEINAVRETGRGAGLRSMTRHTEDSFRWFEDAPDSRTSSRTSSCRPGGTRPMVFRGLGGVHIEDPGETSPSAKGGAPRPTDADLARRYKSTVDPRLQTTKQATRWQCHRRGTVRHASRQSRALQYEKI